MGLFLVNYSTKEYANKQKMNTFSAKIFGGFDKIYSCIPDDIDHDFKTKNQDILKFKKGAGLWLWKPYFFDKILNSKLVYGDYLFHCDSSAFFIKSIRPLVNTLDSSGQDIMAFSLPLTEKHWTSPSLLEYFNADLETRNSPQVLANFLLVKKTKKSILFVKEWLKLCSNINLINDSTLNQSYPKHFKAHRYDQSILSLLSKKYKLRLFRDPSQYGHFPEMYRNNGILSKPNHIESHYKTTIMLLRKSSFINQYSKFLSRKFLTKFMPSIYNMIIN